MRESLFQKFQFFGKNSLLRHVIVAAVVAYAVPVQADETSDRINYGQYSVSTDTLNFGLVEVGDRASQLLTIKNTGKPDSGSLHISTLYLDERDASSYATDLSGGLNLRPGESRDLNVYFAPDSEGQTPGMLFITHSGKETVSIVQLEGVGIDSYLGSGLAPPILAGADGEDSVSFLKSQLVGINSINPTSIQFGPDQRLYAAALDGTIFIYDVERVGTNQYNVTNTEQIDLIRNILNHDDDGLPNFSVNTRLVTGINVTGSADSPVIYVTSSDPRIGGGGSGLSTNLDTNSGILSKLTLTNDSWQKLDLVRGLPRSEENHTANGMAIDHNTGKMYIAMGGNTNMGAPSNNFAELPEYALTAAILEVDLIAIGNSTYDLPTLDDEDRPGINDTNDPFGGNRGKNQAIITTDGPVQVHAPGFRNAYDVLITDSGLMYSWDNGPNGGWGGHPTNVCGNEIVEPGETRFDSLHLISGSGYYAGHPNPTRASTDVTFNSTNPQTPVPFGNTIECEYFGPPGNGLDQHTENLSLLSTPASTNGLAEYTASNFAGAMQGDLLAAAFNNKLYRVKLNEAGTSAEFSNALFSNIGGTPLDVIAQGDEDIFPGTIWVTDFSSKAIVVFEPQDYGRAFGEPAIEVCTADNPLADPDNDGFSTEDENANNTNPCSSADFPQDSDQDGVSDLLDQDDDNDGLSDTTDPFALDASNGAETFVPVSFQWENDSAPAGFIAELGFSGLMTNGIADYSSLYDLNQMTVRGAAGVLTVDSVSPGDALATSNSQQYGFQFGINITPDDPAFAAHTRVIAPFAGIESTGFQSMGLFIGNGDQDNYIKLVINNTGAQGGVELLAEVAGEITSSNNTPFAIAGADYADLHIALDPSTMLATAFYRVTTDGVPGALHTIAEEVLLPSEWLNGPQKLAVGIISTSNSGAAFPATWDFIEVTNNTEMLTIDAADNLDKPIGFCVSVESDNNQDGPGIDNDQSCTVKTDTSIDEESVPNLLAADIPDILSGGSGSVFGSGGRVDLLLMMLFGVVAVLKFNRCPHDR